MSSVEYSRNGTAIQFGGSNHAAQASTLGASGANTVQPEVELRGFAKPSLF